MSSLKRSHSSRGFFGIHLELESYHVYSQKVLCGFPTWRVLSRGDQNPPSLPLPNTLIFSTFREQMQGSSSTTDTDINTKVEDVFTYNSSNSKKARLQSMLSALLSDPILSDVPKKPSIVDVDTLISLELGSAMKISVMKMDNTSFDVAVLNSATVKDLKQAIKNKTEEIEQGQLGHRHISWKHVWANFCLSHHNEKLIDDNSLLQDYGVRNNSQVQFTPCVMSRLSQRHSQRKKHRFFHGLSKFTTKP